MEEMRGGEFPPSSFPSPPRCSSGAQDCVSNLPQLDDSFFMGLSPQPLPFHKSLRPSDVSDAPILQMARLRPRVC